MHKMSSVLVVAALAGSLAVGGALAQSKGGGKIVCWKDKSGKTIGCGDRVPPEYQDTAIRELDRGGITRKVTETPEERARREAEEKAEAARQAEEKRRLAEQRRQDMALLNTFANEQEIDLKRDREVQVADTQLKQLRAAHKNATDRLAHVKANSKDQEDLARAQGAVDRAAQTVAAKEKEKEELRQVYADMKARYRALRGGGAPPATTAATPVGKK